MRLSGKLAMFLALTARASALRVGLSGLVGARTRPGSGTCGWTSRALLTKQAAGVGFGGRSKDSAGGDKPKGKLLWDQAKENLLRDQAKDKLLPKIDPEDGKQSFDNPGVGDFQVFDSLVEYPCTWTIKVVGVDEGDFEGDIRRLVAGTLGTEEGKIQTSTREKGKYMSITLKALVTSSDQLYKCYEAIDTDSRVKFKF